MTLTEQEIREIVRQEMQSNYFKGSPNVAPHEHNDTDGFSINPSTLQGFTAIPTTNNKFLSQTTGTYSYGFGSNNQLVQKSTTNAAQEILNTTISQYPIPLIIGNGRISGKPQGDFQGGYAPDGTLMAFWNGVTMELYVRFDGVWYGYDSTLTA